MCRTQLKDALEHFLLLLKRLEIGRPCIQTDFPNIACFRQEPFKLNDLRSSLTHELRMKTKRNPHVL